VLLAEDNPVNQLVARSMLENIGCTVDVVGNGVEALEALSKTSYDLIFMDCQMPELDGYKATRIIREREAANGSGQASRGESSSLASRSQIIALTAHAMEGDRSSALPPAWMTT